MKIDIPVVLISIGMVILSGFLGYLISIGDDNRNTADKATFHELCLKAGYSQAECDFEWAKVNR